MRVAELGLGWRSHLLACRFDAQIEEHDDCIALRTPGNPTYYWGNCLILPAAPRDEDAAPWLARFDLLVTQRQPESRPIAIGVDAPVPTHGLPSWRAAGVDEIDETAVLTLAPAGVRAAPVPAVPGLVLRPLRWPAELELAIEAQVAAREPVFDEAGYRVFRRQAMRRIAAMRREGIAEWFGAFVGDALAADCGLVHDGVTGRFQYVETQAEWRRRGLCRALVHHVCRHAFDTLGLQHLVMCADPHDVAIGVYRSVGFSQIESHWCLQRRPRRDRS